MVNSRPRITRSGGGVRRGTWSGYGRSSAAAGGSSDLVARDVRDHFFRGRLQDEIALVAVLMRSSSAP